MRVEHADHELIYRLLEYASKLVTTINRFPAVLHNNIGDDFKTYHCRYHDVANGTLVHMAREFEMAPNFEHRHLVRAKSRVNLRLATVSVVVSVSARTDTISLHAQSA